MGAAKAWKFAQLGGDRTVLYLQGWSAPFGRPRQGEIVDAGVQIAKQLTKYAGNGVPPTLHSFGDSPKPWKLHGRWMDAAFGAAGGARAIAETWKTFVRAQQIVRANWGDILSYQIFIHDLSIGMESDTTIAWAMEADVLVDEQQPVPITDTPVKQPLDIAAAMQADLVTVQAFPKDFQLSSLLGILPEISDAIDGLISTINTPFALVYDVCASLSDFETALSSDLVKIGSGLQEVKTGLLGMRDATDLLVASAAEDNATQGLFSGPDQVALMRDKAAADAATSNLLLLIADMQVQIDAATRGTAGQAHLAQDGDSFESIALAKLGSASGARAIRAMNGVRFGKKPLPGQKYSVPRSA